MSNPTSPKGVQNVSWAGINHVATAALRLGYSVLVSRALANEGYGVLICSLSWYLALLPLAQLAVAIQFTKAIGHDPAEGSAFAQGSWKLRAGVALTAATLIVVAAFLIEPNADFFVLITVFAITLPFRVMAVGSQAVLTGFERSITSAWSTCSGAALT